MDLSTVWRNQRQPRVVYVNIHTPDLSLFERSSSKKFERQVSIKRKTTPDTAKSVRCAACGHTVTSDAERIAVDGAHTHTFSNPHGFIYTIVCYRDAPGCTYTGAETEQWTWFPGYSWQIALCAGCKTHLGWIFRQAGDSFHGLVRDRLAFEH